MGEHDGGTNDNVSMFEGECHPKCIVRCYVRGGCGGGLRGLLRDLGGKKRANKE